MATIPAFLTHLGPRQRDHGLRGWGGEARHVAMEAAYRAAQVMNHPADFINVAIEELVRQRFELPAFSTLDELARHVRAVVESPTVRLGTCAAV